MKKKKIEYVVQKHREAGRFLTVDGIRSFVLDKGDGEVVFCIHGVPTSSFLYRKVIASLAGAGLRSICLDLPGLGLSERPPQFDYSFRGLARFCQRAAEMMRLEKFHLVVHDIGGPIGFALAGSHPEKILSLTILNTWIDVVNFRKPLPMRPFEKPLAGEAELAMITHRTWTLMFKKMAVKNAGNIPEEEIAAYVDLLKREDGGKAFLKIMRHFDHSASFRDLCYKAVQHAPYPIQAIWGVADPGLRFDRYAVEIQKAARLPEIYKLDASHLLQEEKPTEIADKIIEISNLTP